MTSRNRKPYDSVLETIGWTPLIRLNRVTRGTRTPSIDKVRSDIAFSCLGIVAGFILSGAIGLRQQVLAVSVLLGLQLEYYLIEQRRRLTTVCWTRSACRLRRVACSATERPT